MNRKIYLLVSIIAMFFIHSESFGQHLIGTELTYTNIGQDSFMIKLVFYRDCNEINTGNARIRIICKTTGQNIATVSITKPPAVDITPICSSGCSRCQTSSCSFPYGIEKYQYEKLVVLNTTCCELILFHQECCRNNAITTGAKSKFFFNEATLNRCITPQNSSPVFRTDPHTLLCKGQDHWINVGAIDPNGDSLVYEFAYPLEGHGSNISYSGQYDY
ncbi:MAG: hypothetical protein U9R42_13040, partial [Bacteroidota bacterium]|nr:hypothetical protein [Bacteroidota bacterium]